MGVIDGGLSVKYSPMLDRTASGFPVGLKCICRTMSVPGSSGQASGSTVGVFPGVQPRKWPSGKRAEWFSIPLKPGPSSFSSARRSSPVSSIRIRAWWMTLGLPGRNSIARTYFFAVIGTGTTKLRNTSPPSAGTA